MNVQTQASSSWDWSKGLAVGALAGGLVAGLVYVKGGDRSLWAWPVPIGVLAGLSHDRRTNQQASQS
jgi:hypothetical protein